MIAVWVLDLLTLFFHWFFIALGIFSFTTGKKGGNTMQYREWRDVAMLMLLLFQLAWGFAAGKQLRFVGFIRGLVAVFHFAAGLLRIDSPRYRGHNPP